MLTTLKRIFFGDDRLFLHGSHLERVLRDDKFHSVPDVGEIVDGPNTCKLVLNYERDGSMRIYYEGDERGTGNAANANTRACPELQSLGVSEHR